MVLEFTSENFEKEVQEAETTIVDFWASWCGPCKMMSPIIDQIAEEVGQNVKVGKVNIDEQEELAVKYGIMSIPTILVIKNGTETKRFVGVQPKENILESL